MAACEGLSYSIDGKTVVHGPQTRVGCWSIGQTAPRWHIHNRLGYPSTQEEPHEGQQNYCERLAEESDGETFAPGTGKKCTNKDGNPREKVKKPPKKVCQFVIRTPLFVDTLLVLIKMKIKLYLHIF